MPIKYYLRPYTIAAGANSHSARILINKTHNLDSIVQCMLLRGSTLTEADIRAALVLAFEVITHEVAEGNSVNLPLVNIRPSIHGLFTHASDNYEEGRHSITASLSAGQLLWQQMDKAQVEKAVQARPIPILVEFLDVNSQSINHLLTPNGIGQLTGDELKFNEANAAEGVFLIGGTGTIIKIGIIAIRTPAQLLFSIPAGLAAGSYTLEVRKGYGNAASIRTGKLNYTLQVS